MSTSKPLYALTVALAAIPFVVAAQTSGTTTPRAEPNAQSVPPSAQSPSGEDDTPSMAIN